MMIMMCFFFFSSRRRHTRSLRDWSSDVCSSDLGGYEDWLRQRTLTRKSEVRSLKSETRKSAAPPGGDRRKLSYKERRELEALPARIETLEAEQRALHERTAGVG